jgi:methylated-DNA-[protein]-cysteine S-methyltransferase
MESAFFLSPLGPIEIIASGDGITSLHFCEEIPQNHSIPSTLLFTVTELSEYFSGSRKDFSFPLAPQGTEFQKQVWKELQNIPFGEKRSYLDIALKLGDKNLTRAVGAANGKNPIAIIVPCHRVIGENGSLTGYTGGLWRKEWLLDFETSKAQGNLFPR